MSADTQWPRSDLRQPGLQNPAPHTKGQYIAPWLPYCEYQGYRGTVGYFEPQVHSNQAATCPSMPDFLEGGRVSENQSIAAALIKREWRKAKRKGSVKS
jgi:hypothetical protein